MPKALINSSGLENVKRQFVQDSLLTFKGHVYRTDLNALAYARANQPIDKDGYPTPVPVSDIANLIDKMQEQAYTARQNYIRRVSDLEAKSLATEKTTTANEQVE